jgi:hypothetical protein
VPRAGAGIFYLGKLAFEGINMAADVSQQIVLLLSGGALTQLGVWLADLRTEKRRKRQKLEDAYIAWLNAQVSVVGRLKALARLAQEEPYSMDSVESILAKFEVVETELSTLGATVNAAFIYEPSREKKQYLDNHSNLISILIEIIGVVLKHHQTHLKFRKAVEESQSLVSQLDEQAQSQTAAADPSVAGKVASLRDEAVRTRDDACEHLTTCRRNLAQDSVSILEKIEAVEQSTLRIRGVLVQ